MSDLVVVEGDGVGAACCARLLGDAGVRVRREGTARPKVAAVLLGEQTQGMLREIFSDAGGSDAGGSDAGAGADLFDGFARVRRRVVRWGGGETVEVAHAGVVAPEGELLRRLWERVPVDSAAEGSEGRWRVVTSRGSVAGQAEICVGERVASFCEVRLAEGVAGEACWAEAVGRGWLFGMSVGGGVGTLIGVGGSLEELLGESRLVAGVVGERTGEVGSAAAAPRMVEAPAVVGRVACGAAAMGFDPLCGEGTGNAVREAFLAAAVIRGAMAGGDAEGLAAHYNARLRLGFLRHLQICREFYSTGGVGAFWAGETAELEAGMARVAEAVRAEGAPRFRLVDRELVGIG